VERSEDAKFQLSPHEVLAWNPLPEVCEGGRRGVKEKYGAVA
jgi:hypothetical protein